MLIEAGYRQRTDTRELVLIDAENDTEFFFLRPRDIADVRRRRAGSTSASPGEDLLLDSGATAEPILPLGFGGSTFRFAGRPGTARRSRTSRVIVSPPRTRDRVGPTCR